MSEGQYGPRAMRLAHGEADGYMPLNLGGLRPTSPWAELLGFEDECRQACLAPRLMLLTLRPEDRFAGRDGMKLAVGSTDAARTFENREDLRERCRVTSNRSGRCHPEDRGFHRAPRFGLCGQRGDRDTVEETFTRREGGIGREAQSFHLAAQMLRG
jgi:hypothetical protein